MSLAPLSSARVFRRAPSAMEMASPRGVLNPLMLTVRVMTLPFSIGQKGMAVTCLSAATADAKSRIEDRRALKLLAWISRTDKVLPGWMNWAMAELWMTEDPLTTYEWMLDGFIRHRIDNQ